MKPMNAHDALEARLGRIDLRIGEQGDHLENERLACICSGEEPSDAEALHLAGCDSCTDLLIELGEGLEALAHDEPGLSVMFSERPMISPRKPISIGLVVGGLCLAAGAMAGVGWVAHSFNAESPEISETRQETKARPAVQKVETPTAVEATTNQNTPAMDPPMAEPTPTAKIIMDPEPTRPTVATEGSATVPVALTKEKEASQKRKTTKSVSTQNKDFSALPRLEEQVLSGREGPRRLNRIPVDGGPRGFGQLRLNSKPAAEIWIDGKKRGWTPIIDLRLPAGPHDVRLVYETALADKKEDRFRILIRADQTWSAVRDNRILPPTETD